jgi:hypothetical protein
MRTHIPAILIVPLLVLLAGCRDDVPTAPPAPSFNTAGADDAVSYDVIELGNLMTGIHAHGSANAVHSNAAGEATVVGTSYLYGNYKAVAWRVAGDGSAGAAERLGELPAPFDESHPYQVARDVNAAGVIVGESLFREGANIYAHRTVGFLYDGEMKLLPWLVGDSYAWVGWEINDQGMVAGWIRYASDRDAEGDVTGIAVRGALWLPPYEDVPILLEPLEGYSSANARTINNDGMIAGWSFTGADTVGVYWLADAAGSVTGPYPVAAGFRSTAVNAAGHIAGHAFGQPALWNRNSGSLSQLGTLHQNGHGQAFGINDGDGSAFRVVGWSGRSLSTDTWLPTIWRTADGSAMAPVQLALPGGYSGGYAGDIDGRGWIVGVGFQKNRNQLIRQPILWRTAHQGGDDGGGDAPCKPHPKTGVCR